MDKNKITLGWLPDRVRLYLNRKLFNVEIKIYLAFFIIIMVGFWPVSTGIFSLKNDEIIYFLPYRYNIVENLRNGHLPLWSPYVYMGFPISGDMQSGAWNPIVWLLALTGRYTLTTLHAELLIYIYFAMVGLFKLMRILKFSGLVCFSIAVSYAFSGFIIDSGQFMCWVSCACFLPYTYIYFIRLLKSGDKHTSIKFALANICLLIVAGYPFFFIANIYFLTIAFLIFAFVSWRNQQSAKAIVVLKYLLLSVLLFTLVSAAPLLCFINLLPHYSRGTNMPLEAALFNSYAPFSSISFLFPFSITRDHLNFKYNNVLSRNLYVGIIMLPFIIKGILTKRTLAWNTIFVMIVVSFALSLGEALPFRKWAYWYLPLMNTFRHPSNFRLFITIGLLSFAAKGLQEFLSSPKESGALLLKLFYLVLFCTILLGVLFIPLGEANPFFNASATVAGLKKILNILSFKQAVFLSWLVQVPSLIVAIILLKKEKYYLLCTISLLNLVVLSQPQLLSSTVAKNSVAEFNLFIKTQPEGFPFPLIKEPIDFPDETKSFIYEYKEPIKYFFNKKIAINTYINNPTILKSYATFINDSSTISRLRQLPFIFLADSINQVLDHKTVYPSSLSWFQRKGSGIQADTNNHISFVSFQPNKFRLAIKMADAGFLVILQNNFPGWIASAGSTSIPIDTVNDTFMGLHIPAGSYIIDLEYKPGWFIPGIIITCLGSLLMVFVWIYKPIPKTRKQLA